MSTGLTITIFIVGVCVLASLITYVWMLLESKSINKSYDKEKLNRELRDLSECSKRAEKSIQKLSKEVWQLKNPPVFDGKEIEYNGKEYVASYDTSNKVYFKRQENECLGFGSMKLTNLYTLTANGVVKHREVPQEELK